MTRFQDIFSKFAHFFVAFSFLLSKIPSLLASTRKRRALDVGKGWGKTILRVLVFSYSRERLSQSCLFGGGGKADKDKQFFKCYQVKFLLLQTKRLFIPNLHTWCHWTSFKFVLRQSFVKYKFKSVQEWLQMDHCKIKAQVMKLTNSSR